MARRDVRETVVGDLYAAVQLKNCQAVGDRSTRAQTANALVGNAATV